MPTMPFQTASKHTLSIPRNSHDASVGKTLMLAASYGHSSSLQSSPGREPYQFVPAPLVSPGMGNYYPELRSVQSIPFGAAALSRPDFVSFGLGDRRNGVSSLAGAAVQLNAAAEYAVRFASNADFTRTKLRPAKKAQTARKHKMTNVTTPSPYSSYVPPHTVHDVPQTSSDSETARSISSESRDETEGKAFIVNKKRAARLCKAEGCSNTVVQGGVCISHGARRKQCKIAGCTKSVKKAGLCSAHGPARKRCEYVGCVNTAVQGGLCISHGARKRLCEVPGCTKKGKTSWNQMCKRHYDLNATSSRDVNSPCDGTTTLLCSLARSG